jgi:hypothetical protein
MFIVCSMKIGDDEIKPGESVLLNVRQTGSSQDGPDQVLITASVGLRKHSKATTLV